MGIIVDEITACIDRVDVAGLGFLLGFHTFGRDDARHRWHVCHPFCPSPSPPSSPPEASAVAKKPDLPEAAPPAKNFISRLVPSKSLLARASVTVFALGFVDAG
ncbi:unnamed protein product [Spirodela intermedia]|uniref:Uncharacterized protein n=1 Tax=Spirodela intermedia TaxID=51605 RepID=A0A7I8JBB4_SPIIN|nr:unnamed protein product [Spirodela intermedia]CAA6667374.1 unnamed protein product [Spirodela intermedia]